MPTASRSSITTNRTSPTHPHTHTHVRHTLTTRNATQPMTTDFAPVHPGEILNTEFLEPLGISQYRIAKAIDVHPRRINEIVHGKRGITADTGLRLARALCVGDMFFINMQAHYDAEVARDELANTLKLIKPAILHSDVDDDAGAESTSKAAARSTGKALKAPARRAASSTLKQSARTGARKSAASRKRA